MPGSSNPAVSIVLPTYNRARFLPAALASIRAQTLADWELIIVDDGSTDDTERVVSELAAASTQPVRYHRQANQGPSGARDNGIAIAQGRFVAFFDSDDLWLPHHLADCVEALEAHPEIHWVYGACESVDLDSGKQLEQSSFYPNGRPHPFLSLTTRTSGTLSMITDARAAERMIGDGLMCGLQCSVLRRELFDRVRLPKQRLPYVDVTDQIFVTLALKAGFKLAYFDRVHTIYRVHNDSVSVRRQDGALDKEITVIRELIDAYERLPGQVSLSRPERSALRRRLANDYFWTLGYSLLWQHGLHAEAFRAFHRALRLRPLDLRQWKSYLVARTRRPVA